MKKEIKIRVWNKIEKVMFSIGSNPNLTNYQTTIYELMQFTGLKDKNGKDIYERDIVRHIYFGQEKQAVAVVIFEGYEWKTVPKNRGKRMTSYEMWSDVMNEEGASVEIIGNIYENPDLLTP